VCVCWGVVVSGCVCVCVCVGGWFSVCGVCVYVCVDRGVLKA